MVEVKLGWPPRTVDLPYTVHLYHVSVEQFEQLAVQTWAELLCGIMVVRHPAQPWYYPEYSFLSKLMRSFVDERNLGQIVGPGVRVRLDETTQLIPDAFFLTPDQKPSRTIRSVFDGVPTLVLEMTQPWGDEHHLENKIKTYQFAQVGEIWLVNADQGEVTVGTPTP